MMIRVDYRVHETDATELTGEEILRLAGKAPHTHVLVARFVGGGTRIDPDERVRIGPPIERFQTIPRSYQ